MDTHTDLTQTGKVYLVGAGPSDPGLLTVKGYRILKQAQVVIYDALIGPGIYSLIPREAEKISVGKRAGRHSVKQEEINRMILEYAQKGKRVVRLKGGDPFLFGRGGEELELLAVHQIPYEIVPGVTSAIAAAAYAGIPVTHRAAASGVHILTGHKKQNEPLDIDFQALRQAGGTCVVLMGMSALHEIVTGFLNAEMPPDTPAAVIGQGTGADQRSVVATLAVLEEDVRKQQIKAPAVIVIGQTAAFANRYAWRERLPLHNARILITRPAERGRKLSDLLEQLGAEVVQMPTIRTQIRDCGRQLSEQLSQIAAYQYLAFTSPAGVDYFFELLDKLQMDVRCIGTVRLAVIGTATGEALKKRGLRPDLMPEQYHSIALGRLLRQSMQGTGRVLLLRSSMGSRELIDEIKQNNQQSNQKNNQQSNQQSNQIEVTDLAIYDTLYTHQSEDLYAKTLVESGQIAMVMFTSASSVRGFVHMTKGADYSNVRAVCIGRVTANQAAGYGMQVYQAEKETMESMAEAAVKLQQGRISVWSL